MHPRSEADAALQIPADPQLLASLPGVPGDGGHLTPRLLLLISRFALSPSLLLAVQPLAHDTEGCPFQNCDFLHSHGNSPGMQVSGGGTVNPSHQEPDRY